MLVLGARDAHTINGVRDIAQIILYAVKHTNELYIKLQTIYIVYVVDIAQHMNVQTKKIIENSYLYG